MRHATYLLVLLACLAATVPLDLVLRLHVLRHPLRLLVSLLPGFVVFVAWDLYAVHAGQWTYDPRQVLGVTLPGGLPLEEVLFFVVVPVCAVLTLEAVRRMRGRS